MKQKKNMKLLSLFHTSMVMLLLCSCESAFNITDLKSIYYQIYKNDVAQSVQKNAKCVVSTFSIPKWHNSIDFSFHGILDDKKHSLISYNGQMQPPENMTDTDQPCFVMYSNSSMIHNSTPAKKKYFCFVEYEPSLSWLLISNFERSAFFAMVHDRFSASDRQEVWNALQRYLKPHEIIITADFQSDCTFLNPPW